jgi:hypothetical protein
MMEQAQVKQAKDLHKERILSKPNVVGVGLGYKETRGKKTDELCVVALVRRKVPEAGLQPSDLVPREVDGIPTDVMDVGELRAQAERTDRWRPAPGGVSIGHYKITAGTFGTVVRDRSSGERLILSNNHVLANSNDATVGDPILQPGTADDGREDLDTIAELARFCPIQFVSEPATCAIALGVVAVGNWMAKLVGSHHRLMAYQSNPQAVNTVDAAVARPLNQADILDEILEIGTVAGTVEASLGMAVRKSGRTTGLTTGQIAVMDASVTVSYGEKMATYEGQLVSGPMSQPGDSGSLLVESGGLRAVGLLFAGSEQATIFNPIRDVLDCLEVDL